MRSGADKLTRQVEGEAVGGNRELGELRDEMRKGLEEVRRRGMREEAKARDGGETAEQYHQNADLSLPYFA